MSTITLQAVQNTDNITSKYIAYEWSGISTIYSRVFEGFQAYLPNDNILNIWEISEEHAKFWEYYTAKAEGDTLTLTEKTQPKEELGRRIFGEVGNVHANADILRELALIHLRHAADTGHVVSADQNTYIKAERLYQRADIVHTIHRCLPNTLAAKWLETKDGRRARFPGDTENEHYLDFFHDIAHLYHRAVFHTDPGNVITWDEFAAQEYGEGRQFTSPDDLQDFYKAVQEACHTAQYTADIIVSTDDVTGEHTVRETRPADIVRATVFAVEGVKSSSDSEPKYPSVAPTIEVETADAGGTICEASVTTYNTTGDVSYQWYLNDAEIAGATEALFDYAGHSGDLKVIATATDYIGGTVSAESSIIKIA